MSTKFLTEDQVEHLEEYGWDVTPECASIKLYRDEISPRAWNEICKHLKVNTELESATVLFIGVQ
jgi:hypothetical protein